MQPRPDGQIISDMTHQLLCMLGAFGNITAIIPMKLVLRCRHIEEPSGLNYLPAIRIPARFEYAA